MAKPRKIKPYNIRKHCDDLWRDLIKLRAGGKCERCNSTNVVQSHHIIPRTNWNLRFDERNGVALCKRHHIYWAHKDAIAFINWLNIEYPGRAQSIERRRYCEQGKKDYTLLKIYLEVEIKKLEEK